MKQAAADLSVHSHEFLPGTAMKITQANNL
jgi:hypothetical protein